MDKEIENKKTMDKDKSKKQVKKKITGKQSEKSAPKKDSKPTNDINVESFPTLDGRFLLVRVGTDSRPAIGEDIKEIEAKLIALFEENDVNCLAFVTHHAVEITVI